MKHSLGGLLRGVAVCVIAMAALSSEMRAQAEYYQEVTKDGRIYVFVTEAQQKAWETSGEMGTKAITRLDYGPNGESVVFENPKAVELYNPKHGKTEAPPAEVKTTDVTLPFNVQYRMPGLRFSFAKAEVNLSNRAQFRFTQEDPDTAVRDSERGSFRIRRFRTKLDGWIYSRDLTFELQADWVGIGIPGTDQSGPILLDGNLDYDFTKGKRAFRLKAGQFKAPFGRQELTSSGNQEFLERSIASLLFAPSRQLGAQVHGQFGPTTNTELFTYALGLFNGNGIVRARNENEDLQFVARAMFSPFGNVGYSEANLENYPFRVSFGAHYQQNDAIVIPTTGAPTGTDSETWGAEFAIKALGSLFAYFEYYDRTLTSPTGVDTPQTGFTGQLGWLFLPKWEVAGRWSETDLNTDLASRKVIEHGAALNWYFNRHNWKLQADYSHLESEQLSGANGRPPAKDKLYRVQAQLIF